jgi:alpha-tubulin suppressor-like RCC1 family protein
MPGKLTDNDTRVSSLFQYMRPRPNNLILTNTIVSGDFQVKASAIIPNLTVNNLVISDTTTSSKGITLKYQNGSIDGTIYYNVSGVIAKPEAISCGGLHTAILLNTGKVLTFGSGDNGRLGHSDTTGSPYGVTDASGYDSSNAIAVSCGDKHTAVLLNTGKVITFGDAENGRLGDGQSTTDRTSPTGVMDTSGYDSSNAVAVSCGSYQHTSILLNTGKVLTFGLGSDGQLGNGTTTNSSSPTGVTDASGYDHTNAVAVSCGVYHTAILLNTGKVVTFGKGDNGQLGNGLTSSVVPYGVTDASGYNSSNAIAVSCGGYHTAILLNTGKVVTFGKGQHGRLGNNSTVDTFTPVEVTDASGYDSTNAVAISCGNAITSIVLNTGMVVSFGQGNYGRLGNNSTTDTSLPVALTNASGYDSANAVAIAVGFAHSALLLNTGKVVTFGWGDNHQLDTGNTTTCFTPCAVADASGYLSNNALTVSKYIINTGFDLSQNFSGGIQDNFNQMTTNHKLNNYERSFVYDNSDISITATLPVNNSSFRKSGTY